MSGKKGMVHKNKQFLLKRLQDMYGNDFDPVMQMSANAVKLQSLVDSVFDDSNATPKEKLEVLILAISAWEKPAQYTNAKLRAMEVTGGIEVRQHRALSEMLSQIEELGQLRSHRDTEGVVSH